MVTTDKKETHNYNAIILFDGVCNLCNTSINFIIDRDKTRYFRFASLQSVAAKELLTGHTTNLARPDSVLLLENGKVYAHSTAALRIARKLAFPWSLFYPFIVLPAFLRDAVYKLVAKNRYNWFGKSETCRMPSPELKGLFLEEGK